MMQPARVLRLNESLQPKVKIVEDAGLDFQDNLPRRCCSSAHLHNLTLVNHCEGKNMIGLKNLINPTVGTLVLSRMAAKSHMFWMSKRKFAIYWFTVVYIIHITPVCFCLARLHWPLHSNKDTILVPPSIRDKTSQSESLVVIHHRARLCLAHRFSAKNPASATATLTPKSKLFVSGDWRQTGWDLGQ